MSEHVKERQPEGVRKDCTNIGARQSTRRDRDSLGFERQWGEDGENSLQVVDLKPQTVECNLAPVLGDTRGMCKCTVVEVRENHGEELVDQLLRECE